MLTTEDAPDPTTPAQRFGAVVHAAAERAGYDLRTGAGGRAALAKDTGMSASAVGRMLRGETLPRPSQFERIAQAVHLDLHDLLVRGAVISSDSADNLSERRVRSQPITPENAADAWGITNPMIRKILLANIRQAISLQRESERELEREQEQEQAGGNTAQR